MTRFSIVIIGGIIFFLTSCVQEKKYDINKISTETQLYFNKTEKRGIESKTGVIYYVEKDLKTITAYENNKIKWQTNISKICNNFIGKHDIWFMELSNDTLFIKFGSVISFANVDIKNGKATFLGSD
jgi:hypothetical protein